MLLLSFAEVSNTAHKLSFLAKSTASSNCTFLRSSKSVLFPTKIMFLDVSCDDDSMKLEICSSMVLKDCLLAMPRCLN